MSGSKEAWKLEKTDVIPIKCDMHPWMSSWLFVTDTPYFAVTDRAGSFSIEGVPAGEHKIEYWHEYAGKAKGAITVSADGTVEPIEFKMSKEEKGRTRRRK